MTIRNPLRINLPLEFSMSHVASPISISKLNLEGSKTLAGMLLAAVMAALLVVADQMIDTWADGHLLAGWVALWTVAFAALALLAPPLRQLSSMIVSSAARWSAAAKERRMEEIMWEYARRDPRIMAELRHARTRSLSEA
jgi:hypothetical protein